MTEMGRQAVGRRTPTASSVSIIVCTCNRADSLRPSLDALNNLRCAPNWEVEIIVVDNGSGSETEAAVRSAAVRNRNIRYIHEPTRGLSHARNTGLRHAAGNIILFCDDDVVVAQDWATEMVTPLLEGTCDMVTGRVTAPPELMRPWMAPMHKVFLALGEGGANRYGLLEVFGASMGFRRSVLESVCGFDPQLGAGALGFGEETLFALQLHEAGFRIAYAPNARSVHHFDAARLRRRDLLNASRQRGRSMAYLQYHWEHNDVRYPRMVWLSYWLRLNVRRMLQRPTPLDAEGCAAWEMSYVYEMELCRHFCRELQRPRQYSRRGLQKYAQTASPLAPVVADFAR